MAPQILIIGGVALGPKAACRAKRLMPDAEVTMLDQDSMVSYGGCGIPYFISGDIAEPEALRSTSYHALRDERFFERVKGVRTLTQTRALDIDRQRKQVLVQNLVTQEERWLPYDKLVLATGSTPLIPPIPGVTLDGVCTVDSLHRAIDIKSRLTRGEVGRAVILGGGAIGLEMAEVMADLWGVEVSVVEMASQVLPRLVDDVVAAMVQHHLQEKGVSVHVGEQVLAIEGDHEGKVRRLVTSKRTIDTDLVILATGVRPNSRLAQEARLAIGQFGGILVNQRLQTSDPDIYAGGDCVEVLHLITGGRTFAPLGSLANRQGRVIGSNLAGRPEIFEGVVGSFIIKVFDICVAATGLALEAARTAGFSPERALVVQTDKAHFYPDSSLLYLAMTVDKKTQRVLGVHGVGANSDSLLVRIGAVAAILKYRPLVQDIGNLELPYSPPYASAMDAINALGNTAQNTIEGLHVSIDIPGFMERFNNRDNGATLFVDVRDRPQAEPLVKKYGPHWVNIPQNEFLARMDELPADKDLILICNAGGRSYEIQLILRAGRNREALNLQGGIGALKKAGIIL